MSRPIYLLPLVLYLITFLHVQSVYAILKSLLHYCTLIKRKKLKTLKVNYIVIIFKYDGFKANITAKISSTLYVSDF